ncbi:hypothetical protein [Corynebacterium meridianum]|uniref:Secreted protein n=1 Tax=Corynebacterium meridianum TaxID=2765363 RepID=A0A934M4G5_9CORY|nr:hypothetical protein [Corynebacterium meridianum]MBI8989001.1 hypothetical protein [Corynebacterium meridianum]
MKLLSRKSLVSAAAVIALSTSGLAAPAIAADAPASTTAATTTAAQDDKDTKTDEETPKKDGSSVDKITEGSSDSKGNSSEGSSDSGSSEDTKTCLKNGKEKPCTPIDYYVSKISGWVKMLTTVASLFTAIFAISNAIQKVTKIAG